MQFAPTDSMTMKQSITDKDSLKERLLTTILLTVISTMIKPVISQSSVTLMLQEALGTVNNFMVMMTPMLKSDKDSKAEEVEAKMQPTSSHDMNIVSSRMSSILTNIIEIGNLAIINRKIKEEVVEDVVNTKT